MKAATLLSVASLLLASVPCRAQQLPPPSRTAFKCTVGGKVSYSDSPCEGAQRLQLEPTRGMNKSSGRELIGTDVRNEHQREQIAEMVRPITGLNPQQMAQFERRLPLSPEARRECAWLDQALPQWKRRKGRQAPRH
ncbi:MAG TPA: DUF4124 domain-containing protein [Burkholderiaceae bacterium]|nr:DUF4124 domain-containing protein [Burkholderiaceae bacterium]